jgi:hypothetical protein
MQILLTCRLASGRHHQHPANQTQPHTRHRKAPRIRTDIVERIEDDVELLHVGKSKLLVLDVAVVRLDIDLAVESARHCEGRACQARAWSRQTRRIGQQGGTGIAPEDRLGGNIGLALANVLAPEQELPVQVAHVDGVQVDDFDLAEARQDQDLHRTPEHRSSRHEAGARAGTGPGELFRDARGDAEAAKVP